MSRLSKRFKYYRLRDRGVDRVEAAKKAGYRGENIRITAYQLDQERPTFEAEIDSKYGAAPLTVEQTLALLPPHLLAYWQSRSERFKADMIAGEEDTPLKDWIAELTWCLENEGLPRSQWSAPPGKPQAQRDVGAISRETSPLQNSLTTDPIEAPRGLPAKLVDSKGLNETPQPVPSDQFSNIPEAVSSPTGPQNVTGDPFNRPDYPLNPSSSWSQFEQQRAEEDATRRWLIAQIQEGHHE
jgi:hypothetical protein